MNKARKTPRTDRHIKWTLTNGQAVKMVLAAYLLLMLLLQLFTFEEFPGLLSSASLAGVWAIVAAIFLVLVELTALPFLLSVEVASAIRRLSQTSVFVALAVLSVLEVLAYGSGQSVMFGATFDLPSGTWSFMFLVALWVLAAWSALQSSTSSNGKKVKG